MSRPRCPGRDTRYWTPDDAYVIRCPHCGNETEFFKDEPVRRCRSCRKEVRNPRIDLGCAEWCKFAAECLGLMPQSSDLVGSLCQRLVERMQTVFGDDQRRIDHALAVLDYAEQIMRSLEDVSGLVVRAAAILHDIGIGQAEQVHNSAAGKFQEMEGPPLARQILDELNVEPAVVDHVCAIVANHHSAKDIDTPEFQIVWDADQLVNIPQEHPDKSPQQLRELIEKVFRTDAGRALAEKTLLG